MKKGLAMMENVVKGWHRGEWEGIFALVPLGGGRIWKKFFGLFRFFVGGSRLKVS